MNQDMQRARRHLSYSLEHNYGFLFLTGVREDDVRTMLTALDAEHERAQRLATAVREALEIMNNPDRNWDIPDAVDILTAVAADPQTEREKSDG